jgi:hypothetical protein
VVDRLADCLIAPSDSRCFSMKSNRDKPAQTPVD